MLNGYLCLRKLVVQRTKLIDETQDMLLEMLEDMTTGSAAQLPGPRSRGLSVSAWLHWFCTHSARRGWQTSLHSQEKTDKELFFQESIGSWVVKFQSWAQFGLFVFSS